MVKLPQTRSLTETFSAAPIFIKLRTDGFRRARSIPATYDRSRYAAWASRSCDHPFASRSSRIRLPRAFRIAVSEGKPHHVIDSKTFIVDYK